MMSDLKFGTSGLRGLVSELTDEVCRSYTIAFLSYLQKCDKQGLNKALLVGYDLRSSSQSIAQAVMRAAKDFGFVVTNFGSLPTPALALAAKSQECPAIMITGSHIPDDRNGLKFYRSSGEINKEDEKSIIANLKTTIIPKNCHYVPEIDQTALSNYRLRCLSILPPKSLLGMRIGVYQHSSVARDLLVDILRTLAADVISIGRSDRFIAIDTEALGEEDHRIAENACEKYRLDAVVSTDGDADRPLIANSDGAFINGDLIGILTAQFLGAKVVATPVTSTAAVERCGLFAKVYRCQVGSPYVIDAMQHAVADGNDSVVGFEANGGVLLGSNFNLNGHVVQALATRDAILPILCVLGLAKNRNMSLIKLRDTLPPVFTESGRLQKIEVENSHQALEQLQNDKIRERFFAQLGPMKQWDKIDGLRVILKNGDTIHFRASGNAPELRCYSQSSNQERARFLLNWGLSAIKGLMPTPKT